jgi:hypothetical protein
MPHFVNIETIKIHIVAMNGVHIHAYNLLKLEKDKTSSLFEVW